MTKPRFALFICHLIGNALLLWLGYYWLGVNESTNARLLWSALLVVVFLAGTVWLHGMALAHFSGIPLLRAGERSARSLVPLFVLGLLVVAVYAGLAWLNAHLSHTAYVIASWLTLHLRRPVSPGGVGRFLSIVIDVMRFVVVPVVLLPLARAISLQGWRGWAIASLQRSRAVRYWIEVGVLLFLGIWIPLRLFFWIPTIASFRGQFWSFAARLGVGYLVFVVALLAAEFFTSWGKPREIQPSTVVSP